MDQNSDWILFITGLIFSTLGYALYYYLNEKRAKIHDQKHRKGNLLLIVKQRLTGIFIFGILPLIILSALREPNISRFFSISFSEIPFLWLIILVTIIISMNYAIAGKDFNLNVYPQIRNPEWNYKILFLSALSWTAYLLAYEFLFRGLLLFSAINIIGLIPAIVLNTVIYTLVHIPKGFRESLGAIPMGIILCLLAFNSGSFWIAFILHTVMALSNEWFSLKFHKKIKFIIK